MTTTLTEAVRPDLRGLKGWARTTQVVLALWLLLFAVAAGISLVQRDLLMRLRDDPASVRLADVTTSDHQVDLLNWTAIGLLVVTAVVWLVWWTKAYCAARDTRGNLRYGRGWAIGGWFVPFANLVVPKRVTDDLWTASVEPEWPRDQEARSSYLILGWWASCILSVVIAAAGERDPDTVSEALTRNAVLLARTVAVVVAAVLAIRLIERITAGFVAQVAPVADGPVEDEAPAPSHRRAIIVTAVVAIVLVAGITVASRAVFDVGLHSSTPAASRRVTPAGHHFSLEMPRDWFVNSASQLSDPVALSAVHLDDGADLTVLEYEAQGPVDPDAMRQGLEEQFDPVPGTIEQSTTALPAGQALTMSFTAMTEDDSLFDARAYVIGTERFNFLVIVSTPSDGGEESSAALDRIMRSFRVEV